MVRIVSGLCGVAGVGVPGASAAVKGLYFAELAKHSVTWQVCRHTDCISLNMTLEALVGALWAVSLPATEIVVATFQPSPQTVAHTLRWAICSCLKQLVSCTNRVQVSYRKDKVYQAAAAA